MMMNGKNLGCQFVIEITFGGRQSFSSTTGIQLITFVAPLLYKISLYSLFF